ncbi:MAG TPA: hypothetical protein VJS92_06470 [Candidatus Polarisedimenticolaceae bacterium]|nr:hypothetical protein [Candidatus Polarisedimenticolaceae bacterium]
MIRLDAVLALARAESRLTLRLVRFWVFQVMAFIVGLAGFFYYVWIHRTWSTWSATVALINPRYLVGFIGIYYLVLFLIGLIFLGYDVRARDTRERMVEVLDALPVSNLELVLGRFFGLLLPAWIPVVVIAIVLSLLGKALGSPIEPWSMITFTVTMALPAYVFVLGLVFLGTLLLRHRLLAALVLLGVVVGLIVLNFGFVKIMMLPLVDLTGGFSVQPPSDLLPAVIDYRGFMQRSGLLLIGLGLLWLSAAVHPRRDDSRRAVRAAIGAGMVLGGAGLCASLVLSTRGLLAQKAVWKAAHTAKRDAPTPDLLALSGDVTIDPGRTLGLKLDLKVRAKNGQPLDTALFSLNPGLVVSGVSAAGQRLEFQAHEGLLEVRLPARLEPGAETTLHLEAAGEPDPFFAYLDAVFEPLTASVRDGNVFLLGFEPSIYRSGYIALLPGIRWLPNTGAEIGRDDPLVRPTDFYTIDLNVELPAGWLVAGPGRRQPASGAAAGHERFRFAPPGPVPDVALIAGRFVSRSIEIEGLTVEALLHANHVHTLDTLAPAAGQVRDWLAEHLREAKAEGLAYPYDALTLVEVPDRLRGYGGGWRMDSTLQQPALVLTREAGFPTARFDLAFRDPKKFEDKEGGMPRAMRETLERFFETDFSGGNPFLAASRSFFGYQTSGEGAAGMPLDYVWQDLANRLVSEKQGYFSVHHYGQDLNSTIGRIIGAIFQNDGENLADVMIRAVTSRPQIWDTVLGVSLAQLDPWKEPKRTVDVLTLKGGAMARSVLDGLGREKSAQLLATLRREHGGGNYTRADVISAGNSVGEDLGAWMDTWIDQTALPGFALGEVRLDRISDSGGAPHYQLLLTLRNDEPVPGLVRIDYRAGDKEKGEEKGSSAPVRVPGHSAVEIGLVTSKPPSSVVVVPYLSLNRESFNVPLPTVDEEKLVETVAWTGSREAAWVPYREEAIVVDDLDSGFSVEEKGGRGAAQRAGASSSVETDDGLPVADFGRAPYRWSRRANASAFGKYRHTFALVRSGRGDRRAIFRATLPRSGNWEVEYHVPPPPRDEAMGSVFQRRGTWNVKVIDSSGTHDATVAGAHGGWTSVGRFELAGGEVRLEVSDKTDGKVVLADAVRFRPTAGAALASR